MCIRDSRCTAEVEFSDYCPCMVVDTPLAGNALTYMTELLGKGAMDMTCLLYTSWMAICWVLCRRLWGWRWRFCCQPDGSQQAEHNHAAKEQHLRQDTIKNGVRSAQPFEHK